MAVVRYIFVPVGKNKFIFAAGPKSILRTAKIYSFVRVSVKLLHLDVLKFEVYLLDTKRTIQLPRYGNQWPQNFRGIKL